MENKKNTLARRTALGLAAAAGLALSLPGFVAPAQAQTTLRLGVGDPAQSSVGQAASRFAELAEEKTGGEVQFQVFADGVLFNKDQNAAINQLGSGALDGLILASSVYASFEPKMNAVSLPYLFSDYDELKAYLAGEPGQELLASLENLGVHGLGLFIRTFRNVTTRETPITTLEDFEGVTLRVPNNPLFVQLFDTLGSNPTPMAFSEVYTALQLEAIDGQENPVEVPWNNKFYEVQNHLNMTQHLADSYVLALSEAAWERIPEEHRAAVEEAAAQMIEERNAEEIAQEEEIIGQLQEAGMQVNRFEEGELQRTQEAARGIYDQFRDQIGSEFMDQSLDFVENN